MPRVLVLSIACVNRPHRRAYDLLGGLPGWEVHIATLHRYPGGDGLFQECEEAPEHAAYTLHRLHVRWPEQGRLSWFRGLWPLIRRVHPAAIFAEYDPASLVILQAAALGRLYGSKVIAFSVENIDRDRWRDARENLRRGRWAAAAGDLFVGVLDFGGRRAADALACINREGEAIFRRSRQWKKPLQFMPLGTDLELFRSMDSRQDRERLGLGSAFVVGYFGRLVPEKGVHLLVEALATLPDDIRLLLDMYAKFAPGTYGDALLRRAQELGVRSRIVTIDVPHGEVPRYMNCCDVIVLPSLTMERWKEQFGRVLPEAMACGVPVIGSRSGNIPDMIGDAGLLVEEGSVASLAAAIQKLKKDPGLRQGLVAAGRARVTERWSVAVQVSALQEIVLAVSEQAG